jgi:hypothetical protein
MLPGLSNAAGEAMRLICALQAVSEDGRTMVGPEYRATLSGPAHSTLTKREAAIDLEGAEKLGLAKTWKTRPNFHGSVQLASQSGSSLSGLLVPMKDRRFNIFWANGQRLTPGGAPITEISGICSPIAESGDRKVMQ